MSTKEERDTLYKSTLDEMKVEYEEVKKLAEQFRTREFLLRRTINGLEHLLEKPEECTAHFI
jgi:hypothetical protein